MNDKDHKVRCRECRGNWTGLASQLLIAQNPFCPEESVYGCPNCKAIDSMVALCEVEGCMKEATCGTPTSDSRYGGYLRCCGQHYIENTL